MPFVSLVTPGAYRDRACPAVPDLPAARAGHVIDCSVKESHTWRTCTHSNTVIILASEKNKEKQDSLMTTLELTHSLHFLYKI